MTDVLDLDALAGEAMPVRAGGKDYSVRVTVATMLRANKFQRESQDPMELIGLIMEEAGMNREEYLALSPAQSGALAEAITARFFGTATAAPAGTDGKSNGPTPSPASSETAEGDTG